MFHILGGHKRNVNVQRVLRHFFASKFPDIFARIYELTKGKKQSRIQVFPFMSKRLQEVIILFNKFVEQHVQMWFEMDVDSYIKYEASFAGIISNCNDEEEQNDLTLICNPYLRTYTIQNVLEEDVIQMRRWFHCEENFPLKAVAVFPVLIISEGYEMEPLLPVDVEIIEVIRHGAYNINEITKRILVTRNVNEEKSPNLKRYIKDEIKHLIKSDVIQYFNN